MCVGHKEVLSLKKIPVFLAALLLLCVPVLAAGGQAAEIAEPTAALWMCIPFAGILLCIAVMPLAAPVWWEHHQPIVDAIWYLLFLIPFAVVNGAGASVQSALECLVDDYLTFIVLLFGLFCVAGNITLEGDLAGSPRVNVALLLFGTMLSSLVGTTGASMLMVRPLLKMNSWRKRRRHIMVFFIFLISNIGGCLTPIGDPPLLMGFSRGVPFFWSLRLVPMLLLNVAVLLFLFYHVDMRAYRHDIAEGRKPDISGPGTQVHIRGLHNVVFLLMIVAAVILSGTLPNLPAMQDAQGQVLGLPIFDTSFAILRRLAKGQSPMTPDRGHIHHRLIDMGFSQKQAVAVLYVISAILGLSAVVLTTSGVVKAMLLLVALCVTGWMAIRIFISHNSTIEEHLRQLEEQDGQDDQPPKTSDQKEDTTP